VVLSLTNLWTAIVVLGVFEGIANAFLVIGNEKENRSYHFFWYCPHLPKLLLDKFPYF
jgi:hypothetical protein